MGDDDGGLLEDRSALVDLYAVVVVAVVEAAAYDVADVVAAVGVLAWNVLEVSEDLHGPVGARRL